MLFIIEVLTEEKEFDSFCLGFIRVQFGTVTLFTALHRILQEDRCQSSLDVQEERENHKIVI